MVRHSFERAGSDGGVFVMMTGGVASAGQFCVNVKMQLL